MCKIIDCFIWNNFYLIVMNGVFKILNGMMNGFVIINDD